MMKIFIAILLSFFTLSSISPDYAFADSTPSKGSKKKGSKASKKDKKAKKADKKAKSKKAEKKGNKASKKDKKHKKGEKNSKKDKKKNKKKHNKGKNKKNKKKTITTPAPDNSADNQTDENGYNALPLTNSDDAEAPTDDNSGAEADVEVETKEGSETESAD